MEENKISEIPLPNKVEVMASCDHLGDKPRRPFVLSYSRTGKQDNRNCFTQAVFPTTSCCDNKKFLLYKSLYSNSSISKQSYGYGLLGDEVKSPSRETLDFFFLNFAQRAILI